MVSESLSAVVKWLSSLALVVFLVFTFGEYPGWYSMGWVTGWVQNYFNPFTELPVLMVCLPLLFLCWIASLLMRRNRIWTTVMMLLAPLSMGLTIYILPPPGFLTVYGIHDHIMAVATLDGLRGLAREIDNDPIDIDENDRGNSKSTRDRLQQLQQRYPFLAWGIGVHGNPYVSMKNHVLDVEWGGALPGHWGFSVSANGARNDSPSETDLRVIRMSDDIYFYHGD